MSTSQLPTIEGSGSTVNQPRRARDGGALVLGRYRLHSRIGAGAFGTVWAGHDERLEREVAVKVIPRERVIGGRFEREARAAARLTHPGIVTLYEAAMDDADAYLVSELVRGSTLDELLDAGRLSDRDIIAIAISLCDALTHAHMRAVVHRDVKPSNVLVPERPSSSAHPAKLTDFGVARVIGGDTLTRTGDIVGTAAYMAPEQAEGREAGAAADLYALALVIYEALTGVNPVRSGTAAMRARRLGAHLPPLRRQRRDLPRELGGGIDLALRPRPRERGTLDELRAALTLSLSHVQDTPGVVSSAWPRTSREHDGGVATDDEWRGDVRRPSASASTTPAAAWPARAAAGVGAATVAGWLTAYLLSPSPIAPAAAAMLAAAAVLALPRVGWLAVTIIIASTAAVQHRPGAALVVVVLALLPVALLPRSGSAWPLAGGAPALGMVGLAGAWPALAARLANSAWRRAALGLTGWVWLALAAPLAGADLYVRRAAGMPGPEVWTRSLSLTVHDVLAPVFNSGTLAAAPVWGLAAVSLPWLLRGRSLAIDCVAATVWAASVVAATEAAIVLAHGPHGAPGAPTALLGAFAAAVLAVSPTLLATWRTGGESGGSRPELS